MKESLLSAQGLSAIAATVSAVAALCALFAVRNTNKIARAKITPILRLSYHRGKVLVKNYGDGHALNLRLEPTTNHYVDFDIINHLYLEDRNLAPGEEVAVKLLESSTKKGAKYESDSIDLFTLAKNNNGKAGIIYEDVLGKSYYVRMKFSDDDNIWSLDTQRIKSYWYIRTLKDKIQVWYFLSGRKRRVAAHKKQQIDKESKNVKA